MKLTKPIPPNTVLNDILVVSLHSITPYVSPQGTRKNREYYNCVLPSGEKRIIEKSHITRKDYKPVKKTIKLLLFLLFFLFSFPLYGSEIGKVIRVIDGDTIEVKNLGVVRVLGIDVYDMNARMVKKQMKRTGKTKDEVIKLSIKGKEFAKIMLLGKEVRLEKDHLDTDRYGRYLRYVYVDGKDYSYLILRAGLAEVYMGDKKIRKFEYYLGV